MPVAPPAAVLEDVSFTVAARMRLIVTCGPRKAGEPPKPPKLVATACVGVLAYSRASSTDSLVDVKYMPRRLRMTLDSDVAPSSATDRADADDDDGVEVLAVSAATRST